MSIETKLAGFGKNKMEQCIAEPVRSALMSFCEQSEEFKQAIEQSDAKFDDCLAAVTKNSGACLSDLEAYKRAVQFYFTTADISFSMTINMSGNNGYVPPPITVTGNPAAVTEKKKIDVSLDDLLDF